MRTDKSLSKDFISSSDWQDDNPDDSLAYNVFEMVEENGQKRLVMNSLSGWERNHLFLNRSGKFDDISLVSGLDSDADTRAHCTLDIDRDGQSDVAIVNGTKPQLQLFRNRIGEISSNPNKFIAVKLVGGNGTDKPSEQWSCRDAVGTIVELTTDGMRYVRELRFGEGFAAQHSSTLLLGIGENEKASLKIHWLSGKKQEFTDIASGKLATIFENPQESDDGSGLNSEDYARPQQPANQEVKLAAQGQFEINSDLTKSDYHIVTSMATWCSACKKVAPQLNLLQEHFGDKIGLIGLPMDEKDEREALEKYTQTNNSAYQMHFDVTEQERNAFSDIVAKRRGKIGLPSTMLIDGEGRVIESWLSVPSISEVATLVTPAASQQ